MQVQIEKQKKTEQRTDSCHPELTPKLQRELKDKNLAYLNKKNKLKESKAKEKVGGNVALVGVAKILGSLGKGATACKAAIAASPSGIAIGVAVVVVGGLIYFFSR